MKLMILEDKKKFGLADSIQLSILPWNHTRKLNFTYYKISTFVLNNTLLAQNPDYKKIQYADNGIIISNKTNRTPQQVLQFPLESEIRVNWSKSEWVK